MKMAIAFEINEDVWQAPRVNLNKLQAKDFVKWLRKQIRLYGRKAELCSPSDTPIEDWLQELGYSVSFIVGGELNLNNGTIVTSGWVNIGYYMNDEDGNMVVKADEMLKVAELEQCDAYLIAQWERSI